MAAVYQFLHDNEVAAFWLMALVVFIVTQLIKWPIKVGTKKLTEAQRKNVNTIILLLPFALGLAIEHLYCMFIAGVAFDYEAGLKLGGESMAFYGVFDKLINIKFNEKNIVDLVKILFSNGGAAIKKLLTSIKEKKTGEANMSDELKAFLATIGENAKKQTETTTTPTTAVANELQAFLDQLGK